MALKHIYRKKPVKYIKRSVFVLLALTFAVSNISDAQDSSPLNINIPLRTLGGKQFWTDIRIQGGWRIQRNHYTNHCRVVDAKNIRQTWGSFDQCQQRFETFIEKGKIEPYKNKIIILLHGVIRTRNSLDTLGRYLKNRNAADVISWGYASTRQTISQHAEKFGELLSYFPVDAEIYLVGHSMGNVVVRRYLKNKQDKRIKRMVMLAPPNRGSAFSRAVNDNLLFETVWGVSGRELGGGFKKLEQQLGTPNFEFGIIAGHLESNLVHNPLLDGPNDLVVTVEETALSGGADFRTVNSTHTRIMNQRETLQYVQRFLKSGYFESPTTKKPIR
ncbi:MAG: hypothetical protein CMJ76_16985 [Planctomycetaceae bacterium]|nr:hypothetical protein [Planctomycetaceae bacterium]